MNINYVLPKYTGDDLPAIGKSAKIEPSVDGKIFYLSLKIDDKFLGREIFKTADEVDDKLNYFFMTDDPKALWRDLPENVWSRLITETGDDGTLRILDQCGQLVIGPSAQERAL